MTNDTMEHADRLAGRVRSLLEADLETIDRATRARLRWSRASALRAPAEVRRRLWLPAGAFATAALALVLLLPLGGRDVQVAAEAGVDVELLVAEENLDLLRDLDFYIWLQDAGGAG
jgi:hypothetical protein